MRKHLSLTIVILIALGFVFLIIGTNFYLDMLWFVNLEMEGVFWIQYLSRWGLRIGAWIFFFLFLFVNLMFTRKTVLHIPNLNLREEFLQRGYYRFITPRRITMFFLLGSAAISFIFTSYTGDYWMEMQQYFNSTSFGVADPVYQTDVAFYVFQLPFWRFIYQYLIMMVVITLLLVGAIHLIFNPPAQVGKRWFFFSSPGLSQLSLLFSFIFFLKAWDYRMQMMELLQSPRGYSFGAGFTDLMVNQRVLWVLLFLALLIGLVCIFNIYLKKSQFLVYGVGALLGVSLLGGAVIPALVQHLLVSPSELSYERPYIEHNIEFTRQAFGLERFTTVEHEATPDLYLEDVEETPGTFNNIRLWDYRPIQQTFTEEQAFRGFYTFSNVNIDRYTVGDDYRQVMLSAREMDQSGLAQRAQTWTNQRLQYTHGYGVVISPVNEATPDGSPRYFLQDIPPRGEPELGLEKPEIYYGNMTDNYVIANTNLKEFNYTVGDTNVYTHYDGEGGIELNSWKRRLLFALRFGDYRVLFTGEIHPESRFMFNRQIQDRVDQVAPFLEYDNDPYIVVSDGELYWIQDAYTVTQRYPYSEPQAGVNYMRNSVKVVIDAYDGSMDFYLVDTDDPLVQTYSKIFPNLFKDMEEIPEGLRDHLRYPVGLFQVQSEIYLEYHVTDPTVFYNREDVWEFPWEKYRGQEQPMEPYYVVLELPGEDSEEFVLINAFTPRGRRNMVAWMAARSDYEHYGDVKVYTFPPDRVISGPMQIENRIDQDTDISEQLTLWDQAGSQVIRGNLLVIPVKESVLYVEPIFLQAEDGGIPELSRVILAFDDNVVMERTLEEGLVQLLGERVDLPESPEELPEELPEEIEDIEDLEDLDLDDLDEIKVIPEEIEELANVLGEIFREAQEKLQESDWAGYGEKMDEIEALLQDLEKEVQ